MPYGRRSAAAADSAEADGGVAEEEEEDEEADEDVVANSEEDAEDAQVVKRRRVWAVVTRAGIRLVRRCSLHSPRAGGGRRRRGGEGDDGDGEGEGEGRSSSVLATVPFANVVALKESLVREDVLVVVARDAVVRLVFADGASSVSKREFVEAVGREM